jgi:AAHS family benzoate transporter-like MFS transporter
LWSVLEQSPLNAWLPGIMRAAGYQLGQALALLLTLNAGAVVGMLIAGRVADLVGIRTVTIVWFVAAAVFLALLSVKLSGVGVFVSVALAGTFVVSMHVLVYAYISRRYPAAAGVTALGTSSGMGRLARSPDP